MNKEQIVKRSALVLVAAPALLVLAAAGCRGGYAAERTQPIIMPAVSATPPERTLTTTGKATLQIEPDIAMVSVRLEVERVSTSTRAASQLSAMKASLLAQVDKLGIRSSQAWPRTYRFGRFTLRTKSLPFAFLRAIACRAAVQPRTRSPLSTAAAAVRAPISGANMTYIGEVRPHVD